MVIVMLEDAIGDKLYDVLLEEIEMINDRDIGYQ